MSNIFGDSFTDKDVTFDINSNNREEKSELLVSNKINKQIVEKLIKEILNDNKMKIFCDYPKSQVGYIKEGYNQIKGINPIDRYNFIIDRYNEQCNQVKSIPLNRIPIHKIFRRIYDLYTWISRIVLGIFLVINYYCYWLKYTKTQSVKNKTGVIVYKRYLINENQDYFTRTGQLTRYNPQWYYFILGIFFSIISMYLVVLFFFIMILPNVFFTIYLLISLIIHKKNTHKLHINQVTLFDNILFESKIDLMGQLNEYIVVDSSNLKCYYGFSYYEKLTTLFEQRDKNYPQNFMIYGDLFCREYDILFRAFYKQLIGIFGFMSIGLIFC